MGLRYKSQYVGRRVAASRERLDAAFAELERREAAVKLAQRTAAARRARRAASARLRRQQATWRARRKRLARAENAYERRRDEAYWRGLVRIAAHLDRMDKSAQRLAKRVGLDLEKHAVA